MKAMVFRCPDCGNEFVADRWNLGAIPPCPGCGGRRAESTEDVDLECPRCGVRGGIDSVDNDFMPECPSCGMAMKLECDDGTLPPSPWNEKSSGRMTIQVARSPLTISPPDEGASVPKTPSPVNDHPETRRGGETTILPAPVGVPEISKPSFAPVDRIVVNDDENIDRAAHDGDTVSLLQVGTMKMSEDEKSRRAENLIAHAGITGDSFGKFRVIREIARGGMGIVYEVEDTELRRRLALKILIEGQGSTEDSLKRFIREARAAANLDHPAIINVYESGEIDGRHYYTMDYIDGDSFHEIIGGDSETKMDERQFVACMRDVCDGLRAAHEHGVIHRDLKPANIIFRRSPPGVVLMDFGLAKDLTSVSIMSMTGSFMGSPAYMSPEQAQGLTHDIDHRTDIYSMGVILYEGVTHEQPFRSETVFDIVTKVVNEEPVPPRNLAPDIVTPALQNIIMKCMEKKASARYQEMSGLIADLDAYLAGSRVRARPVPTTVRAWRRLRRKPKLLGVIMAAPMVIAAFVLAAHLFYGPSYLDIAKESLLSGDIERARAAIKELGERLAGDRFKTREEQLTALKMLRGCLTKSHPPGVRLLAAATLAKMGDEKSAMAMVDMAAEPKMTPSAAVDTLERVRHVFKNKAVTDNDLCAKIAAVIEDRNRGDSVRAAACRAMEMVLGKAAKPTLIKVASDKTEPSKLRVAALASFAARLRLGSPELRDVFNLYSDDDPEVVKAAEGVLRKVRSKDSVLSVYGMKDGVGMAYNQVGGMMAKVGDYNRRLSAAMNEGGGRGKQPEDPLKPVLIKLKDSDPRVRMTAAYDLSRIGDANSAVALTKLLTDENSAVGAVAARSIVALSAKAEPDMKIIRKLLDDENLLVRERAVYIIGELNDTDSVKALAAAAKRESSPRTMAAMARAMTKLGDSRFMPELSAMFAKCAQSPASGIACIDALRSFEQSSAPFLVDCLEKSSTAKVRRAIRLALIEVTGEDHGDAPAAWRAAANRNISSKFEK